MFTHNFSKLIAAVHEVTQKQRNKLSDEAKNNTVNATADSDNDDANNTYIIMFTSQLESQNASMLKNPRFY